MSPRHHLDAATLVSHAAGALSPEMSAVAALHLAGCAECGASLARADAIGGVLVEQQHPAHAQGTPHARLREAMLERLGETPREPTTVAPASADPDRLPTPLHPYFGASWRALKWRWMGPGMHYIRTIGPSGGTMLMLRIGPGRRMPVHGHHGSELTQIVRGAYDDALGHFAAGDVADLDHDTEHQPVTAAGEACICVSALDAPLRFPGWFARRLQPLFGI